jgi:hypothetical protein
MSSEWDDAFEAWGAAEAEVDAASSAQQPAQDSGSVEAGDATSSGAIQIDTRAVLRDDFAATDGVVGVVGAASAHALEESIAGQLNSAADAQHAEAVKRRVAREKLAKRGRKPGQNKANRLEAKAARQQRESRVAELEKDGRGDGRGAGAGAATRAGQCSGPVPAHARRSHRRQ